MFYVYVYLFFITLCVLFMIAFDSKHQSDNEVMFYEDADWKDSNNYPTLEECGLTEEQAYGEDKPS